MIADVVTNLFSSLVSATCGKLWERCRPRKKPLLENAYASLIFYRPAVSERLAKMSFTITNRGPQKCSIKDVKLICSIPVPRVNVVSIGRWPGGAVEVQGVQKLPLPLPIDAPVQVFIHTENSDTLYRKEQYPERVEMQITLTHMKRPLTTVLLRQSDGHQYRQEYIKS
jgi:hypothetical protein